MRVGVVDTGIENPGHCAEMRRVRQRPLESQEQAVQAQTKRLHL